MQDGLMKGGKTFKCRVPEEHGLRVGISCQMTPLEQENIKGKLEYGKINLDMTVEV